MKYRREYVFKCGCRVEQATAVNIDVTGHKGRLIGCPKHRERIDYAIFYCHCGRIEKGSVYSILRRIDCKACAVIRRLNYEKGFYNPEEYRDNKQPEQKPDCRFYSRCLDGSLACNKRQSCEGCKRYIQAPLDISDYMTVRDSMEKVGLKIRVRGAG